MQKDIKPTEAQQGEVIAFYGDLTSINPEDVAFRGFAIEPKTVLAYVKEHKDNPHFTMMYAQEEKSKLFPDVAAQIREINPQTQFMQINSIAEFASYYDKGDREMDRELHPVESVKMLARPDTLFYDVKERAQPVAEKKQVPSREYLSIIDIGFREGFSDLSKQMSEISRPIKEFDEDKIERAQAFLDEMKLQGYDASSAIVQDQINMSKRLLHQEFSKDYILPVTGKTAVESIEKVIPGMPAKSIKEGVMDGIEFAHDLVGDKDRGHLKIEFECHNNDISDCHIKGVYREYEQDKVETKESSVENIKVDKSGKAIYEHESNITLRQENENDSINEYNDDQGYVIGD